MKKITLACILASAAVANAQDTTSIRLVSIENWPSGLNFIADDSISMYNVMIQGVDSSGSSSHALFVYPPTGKLYAVTDSVSSVARNIYSVNPLDGSKTLVFNAQDQYASVEVTPTGRIFAITGNGSTTPGGVYEIDLQTNTSTLRYTSAVPSFEPRALGFNPMTQELVVVTSFLDTAYKTQLDNWTSETPVNSNFQGEEVHGLFYHNNRFILSTYGGDVLFWDPSSTAASYSTIDFSANSSQMDMAEVKFIDSPDTTSSCILTAHYPSTNYKWFHNGTAIPNSNSMSITVSAAGNYQLLTEINGSGNYIWSETIFVQPNFPVVSVSTGDSTICTGDSVLLTGTSGGSSQWYMNGTLIPGATSNTYYASAVGSYNMVKTNLNGCSDSAATAVNIVAENPAICTVSLDEQTNASFSIWPNPFSHILNISGKSVISNLEVADITGRIVKTVRPLASSFTLDTAELPSGVYFVTIHSNGKRLTSKLVK